MMGSRHLESRAKNGDEEFGRRTTRLSSAEENGTVKKRHASGKIKEEDTGDEIREYAATTMSELLGWYGYEKVDSGCTRSLNLDHFASRSKLSEMDRNCVSEGRSSRSPLSVNTSSSSSFEVLPGLPLSYSAESLKISPSLTMKPIHSAGRFLHKSYSTSSCTENLVSCSWCGRLSQTCDPGRSNGLPYSVANALGQFCSEACFAAGRRAVFKRARTCDWCRHVRNPINYVDLQDGESQLQFCSDKCLNQYKMNIFCHETRTHLTLHGLDNIPFHDGEKGGLITPELWFRNCQSPAHSTTDEVLIVDDQSSNDESPASSILEDRRRVDEDTKKPPRSDSKTRKRKNSFRVRKHARSSETGNNFAGSQEEQNQLDRHESLSNQENQNFYRFANPYHYRINCTDSGPPNYSSSVSLEAVKTDKPLSTDFDNRGDSSDRKEGNRANNIHVKDVRELQDERAYDRLIKSPPWLSDSIQFKTPSSQKPFACDSTRTKYRRQTESFPRMTPFVGPSESRQSSTNHPASSLLPPVTVLVPYPIPIPIPIPIPVPSTVFERLAKKQKENTDKNCSCSCKSSKRESDCESTTSDPPSRLSTDLATDSSQDSSSCCHLTASSTNEKNEEEDEDARRVTARPSRKRKRTKVENVEGLQVKRRNKFVAA